MVDHAGSVMLLHLACLEFSFRPHQSDVTNFLKATSLTKSLPPLMLSARYTFPVVAIATMWECSLKGLNEMGS